MQKKTLWLKLLIIAITIYALLNGIAYLVKKAVLYVPPTPHHSIHLPRSFYLKTPGGIIQALYFHNKKAKYTLLYSHGNASDLYHNIPFLYGLYKQGYSVVSYDYNGYGNSAGTPSEKNIKNDINAVYKEMISNLQIKPKNIILLAHSLGTGPTVYLASRIKCERVVLLSPYLSIYRTKLPLSFSPFVADSFDSARLAADILSPTIIIHGAADRIILSGNSKILYNILKAPKKIIILPGAGHNIPFNTIARALKMPITHHASHRAIHPSSADSFGKENAKQKKK